MIWTHKKNGESVTMRCKEPALLLRGNLSLSSVTVPNGLSPEISRVFAGFPAIRSGSIESFVRMMNDPRDHRSLPNALRDDNRSILVHFRRNPKIVEGIANDFRNDFRDDSR